MSTSVVESVGSGIDEPLVGSAKVFDGGRPSFVDEVSATSSFHLTILARNSGSCKVLGTTIVVRYLVESVLLLSSFSGVVSFNTFVKAILNEVLN